MTLALYSKCIPSLSPSHVYIQSETTPSHASGISSRLPGHLRHLKMQEFKSQDDAYIWHSSVTNTIRLRIFKLVVQGFPESVHSVALICV